MSRLRQGILVGFVLSLLIVWLIALNVSDERRRQLSQHFKELRKALPGVEQLKQSVQQATTKTRETRRDLGKHMQESASKLAHHTQ